MNNRVLDLSETPARLRAENGLLHVELDGSVRRTFPFAQVAAVVCSHPQITLTEAVLAELALAKAILVACDRKRMPVAMLLPLTAHSTQTENFRLQSEAPLPLRKRLWKEIVRAKIRAQAAVIGDLYGEDAALRRLFSAVSVSNAAAIEAQASRLYWSRLFADAGYRRSDEEDPRNALLNYGYAVVRAICARALCSAGLHPALPLHHHNRYDPFPLANDLMEPFRPLVDAWAVRWWRGHSDGLTREAKQSVLGRLSGRFSNGEESRTLFDWAQILSDRLARCLDRSLERLEIPLLEPACDETQEGREEPDPE
jgi:CRISPR-associated protein Cas1